MCVHIYFIHPPFLVCFGLEHCDFRSVTLQYCVVCVPTRVCNVDIYTFTILSISKSQFDIQTLSTDQPYPSDTHLYLNHTIAAVCLIFSLLEYQNELLISTLSFHIERYNEIMRPS